MLFAADFRYMARQALKGRWGLAVVTGFVASLLGVSSNFGGSSNYRRDDAENFAYTQLGIRPSLFFTWLLISILLFMLIYFLIGGAIQLGYCQFNLNLINRTNPQFKDLFSRIDIFWKACGLKLLISLFTFLWSLLFIIPGIIAAISYSMAPYLMAENPDMGIGEAISRSKEMMDGNKWRYFCLLISFIGWLILSSLTFGLGFFLLNPYINAASAVFYNDLSGKDMHRQDM